VYNPQYHSEEDWMSIIDEALQANQQFAAQFREGNLPMPPARKLAVLACNKRVEHNGRQ
jgi:hypothetical protein